MKDREKEKKFEEIYEKYHHDIFRFCMLKTRNRSLSLDITQETFLKLWEYIKKESWGKEKEYEKALLYRIARNLIIDFYRKKKSVSVENMSDYENHHDFRIDEKERNERKLDAEHVLSLVREMPESVREIVILRFVQNLSIREISQITGKSESSVSVNIHRSLKKIRRYLEEGGIDYE